MGQNDVQHFQDHRVIGIKGRNRGPPARFLAQSPDFDRTTDQNGPFWPKF